VISRLPPTAAILVFFTVFKLRSFNKAATELYMTPPGVSYQIKSLEEMLGHQLFLRSAQGVVPTPFAESIYFDTSVALKCLQGIVERSKEHHRAEPVRILATQAFSSLWLLPKMPALLKQFEDMQFEIIGWSGGVDARKNNQGSTSFDIEFRYTTQSDLDAADNAQLIAQDMAIPVCTPDYLSFVLESKGVCACESLTVIHARNWTGIWDRWCDGAFKRPIKAESELYFQSTSLCVQAALSGIGIAIVHAPLVVADIREHRLVRPHPYQLQVEEAYFAVLGRPEGRHAQFFPAFVKWCQQICDSVAPDDDLAPKKLTRGT